MSAARAQRVSLPPDITRKFAPEILQGMFPSSHISLTPLACGIAKVLCFKTLLVHSELEAIRHFLNWMEAVPDLALDLRYLDVAFVVAEYGSFRRAANIMNISQTTLTRRIQILEHRLGVSLFERTRNGAKLTLFGERFLRNATFGAQYLRAAVSEIAHAKQGQDGEIRMGLVSSLAQGVLGDMLEAYRQRYPSVDVKIEEATSQAHLANVLNGRIDVAFIPGKPRIRDCKAKYLWQDEIFVAFPNAHSLACRENIRWSDLREETFLVAADVTGPDIYGIIYRNLSELGFQPSISSQRIGRENLINLVARGYGITLVASSALGITYPGVTFRRIGPDGSFVDWSAIWLLRNLNPALPKLVEMAVITSSKKVQTTL